MSHLISFASYYISTSGEVIDILTTEFDYFYSPHYLRSVYRTKYVYNCTPGKDRITTTKFNSMYNTVFDNATKKISCKTFKFTNYKEVVISKGKGKLPRIICIPTIRDKVILTGIADYLKFIVTRNKGGLSQEFIKEKINRFSSEYQSKKFTHAIKIDMQDFYGSLDHEILFNVLKSYTSNDIFFYLLNTSIETMGTKGVPQGLPISNILADIYIKIIDDKYSSIADISYYRYVDDIFIFCNESNQRTIYDEIIKDLKDIKLSPHELSKNHSKTELLTLDNSFSYLGYNFSEQKISVRNSSKHRLERDIENLIRRYKKTKPTNIEKLIWDINLKITGIIIDKKNYGWLFYYSQINNLTVLHSLDSFILKILNRNNIDLSGSIIKLKKFSRTYHEINKNYENTNYITNVDKLSLDEKRKILEIFDLLKDEAITNDQLAEYDFKKFVFSKSRELEKDIGGRS